MIRRLLAKLSIIYVSWAVLAIGCCGYACCGDLDVTDFNTVGLEVFLIKSNNSSFDPSNERLLADDSVETSRYGIVLDLQTENVAMLTGGMFSQAFACSPRDPESVQKLFSFRITSDQTVVTTERAFQPGEDLHDLFMFSNYQSITNELYGNRVPDQNSILIFAATPVTPQEVSFDITMGLDNGEVFVASTPPVILK